MNLLELKQAVDRAMEHVNQRHNDASLITVRIPSFMVGTAGHMPCTDVKTAGMGIDWEASSFLIFSKNQLREIDRDEIASLKKQYDELGWSHYKINKIKSENKQLKEKLKQLENKQ